VNDAPSADRLAQRPVLPAPPSADGLSKCNSPAPAGLFASRRGRVEMSLLIGILLGQGAFVLAVIDIAASIAA